MRTEDELRRALTERLSRVGGDEEAWASITKRVEGRARHDLVLRLATAGLALAVAVAGVIGLRAAFFSRDDAAERPSPPPSPVPYDPHIVATYKLGDTGQVNALVFYGGYLWASVREDATSGLESGSIKKIDPATDTVVATIPVAGVPTWEVSGEGMAGGLGSVWVAGGDAQGAVVTRIDAETNEVLATIRLPGTDAADISVAFDSAWATIVISDTFTPGGSVHVALVPIDPATNRAGARIQVQGEWIREAFAFDDGTAAAHSRHGETSRLTLVGREGVIRSRELECCAQPLLADPAMPMFITPTQGGLLTLDLSADDGEFDYRQPLDVTITGWMARSDGGLWFVVMEPGRTEILLAHHDGDAGTDGSLVIDENVIGLDVGGGSVWLLGYDGTVTRVAER